MVFGSIYNWLFSSDLILFNPGEQKKPIVLRVGDRVSVHSTRFDCWFDDGIVTATFRDRLTVKYGFERYFGWTMERGNEKTVKLNQLKDVIRPHKLHEVTKFKSDVLRLVVPAVKRGKLNAQPVAVEKAIGSADSLA